MELTENLAFDALSDRVRRRILAVLGEHGEMTVGDLAARVDVVGRTTVSSHLRVLRTSGLVLERRDGRHRLYSLDVDGSVRDALVFLQSILREGVGQVGQSGPAVRTPERRTDAAGARATG